MTIRDSAASSAAYLDAHAYRNEAEFQRSVVELAHALGWWTYHTLRSKGSSAGWPDLVFLRGTEALFVELKLEGKKLTRDQARVLWMLQDAGLRVYTWRPSDWSKIEEVLR